MWCGKTISPTVTIAAAERRFRRFGASAEFADRRLRVGRQRRDLPPELLPVSDMNAVELATELTVAWLSNPSTRASADDVQTFLTSMSDTLGGLTAGSADQQPDPAAQFEYTPAVSVRKSLGSRDHIISMINGKPYKTLKRHLATNGLTPAEYRSRYNLKADYPMVAPGYSESRRETAKRRGLGRKPTDAAAVGSDVTPVAAEPMSQLTEEAQPEARKPRARKGASDTATAAAEPASSPPEQGDAAGATPAKKPRTRKKRDRGEGRGQEAPRRLTRVRGR